MKTLVEYRGGRIVNGVVIPLDGGDSFMATTDEDTSRLKEYDQHFVYWLPAKFIKDGVIVEGIEVYTLNPCQLCGAIPVPVKRKNENNAKERRRGKCQTK